MKFEYDAELDTSTNEFVLYIGSFSYVMVVNSKESFQSGIIIE